jgi:CO dehydrogenase maturation factor
MDNEAGMEHLSRRTTKDVQHLFIISDPTQRGVVAAERIVELKDELEIQVENTYLILNRVPGKIPPPLQERVDQITVPFLGSIPMDENVMNYDFSGKPLLELEDQSPVYQAVSGMLDPILGL